MTKWTKEEQKEHRQWWVEALRSGKYKQGRGKLRAIDNTYCCLGVACEIAIDRGVHIDVKLSESGPYYLYDDLSWSLSITIMDFYGLYSPTGNYWNSIGRSSNLIDDNDNRHYGKSFNEIADIIESEPEGLLVS